MKWPVNEGFDYIIHELNRRINNLILSYITYYTLHVYYKHCMSNTLYGLYKNNKMIQRLFYTLYIYCSTGDICLETYSQGFQTLLDYE